jgi:hypothetical protein
VLGVAGVACGGPRAGSMRPGGPRTGNDCGALCGDTSALAAEAGVVPSLFSRHSSLSPSTNASLPSFLRRSKSSPAPFRASCLQKSYSLIHETSTTLCPGCSAPCSELLSASHSRRVMSQFALAPSVLVRRSRESSRGRRTYGWRLGGMRVEGGMARCGDIN